MSKAGQTQIFQATNLKPRMRFSESLHNICCSYSFPDQGTMDDSSRAMSSKSCFLALDSLAAS